MRLERELDPLPPCVVEHVIGRARTNMMDGHVQQLFDSLQGWTIVKHHGACPITSTSPIIEEDSWQTTQNWWDDKSTANCYLLLTRNNGRRRNPQRTRQRPSMNELWVCTYLQMVKEETKPNEKVSKKKKGLRSTYCDVVDNCVESETRFEWRQRYEQLLQSIGYSTLLLVVASSISPYLSASSFNNIRSIRCNWRIKNKVSFFFIKNYLVCAVVEPLAIVPP